MVVLSQPNPGNLITQQHFDLKTINSNNYFIGVSSIPNNSWHRQNPLPQGNNPQSVTCVEANTCYAVGNFGTILKTQNGGSDWEVQTSGTSLKLNSIYCSAILVCYAVSEIDRNTGNPAILTTDDGGSQWSSLPLLVNYNLDSISCIDTLNCYTVSKNGNSLATFDGWHSWSQLNLANRSSIACPQAGVCFAVGANGYISYTTDRGVTWNSLTISNVQSFSSISCTDSNHCMVVADNYYGYGSIYGTSDGGINWVYYTPTVISPLFAVNCKSPTFCVASGYRGAVLVTQDGGANWTILNFNNLTPAFNSVNCPDAIPNYV